MKQNSLLLLALIISLLIGCNTSPKKSTGNVAQDTEEAEKLNDTLQAKIGSWAKEGAECYGIIVLVNAQKKVEFGRSAKTTIVRIKRDSIKVKALEDVNMGKIEGCMGITVGYTWWEKEGDLFATRDEANNYLKSKDWAIKSKKEGKFKVLK